MSSRSVSDDTPLGGESKGAEAEPSESGVDSGDARSDDGCVPSTGEPATTNPWAPAPSGAVDPWGPAPSGAVDPWGPAPSDTVDPWATPTAADEGAAASFDTGDGWGTAVPSTGEPAATDPWGSDPWATPSGTTTLQSTAETKLAQGKMQMIGLGVARNAVRAVRLFREAAELGLAEAQYELARAYESGEGMEAKDSEQALKWHRAAAKQGHFEAGLEVRAHGGDAEAQFEVGCMERDRSNFARAALLLDMAAEQGHAEAQFEMGKLYEGGDGVAQDVERAAKWYCAAAVQGHGGAKKAVYNQGLRYRRGHDVARDAVRAVRLFREAAELGLAEAQYELGRAYESGEGMEAKDSEQALKWHRAAAKQGHAEASLEDRAHGGDADAQFEVGCMELGRSNFARAALLLDMAAEQGHAEAQAALGQSRATGGVPSCFGLSEDATVMNRPDTRFTCFNDVAVIIAGSKTLKEIDLGYSHLGTEGAKAIGEILEVNTSVTSLDLQYNFIGDEGAKAIAKALEVNTSLTSLNLGYTNKIGDEGAKAIAMALEVNTSLTTLVLEHNNIGDEGAKAIAKALKVNTSLTTLELHENPIGDDGAKAIAIGLKLNASLTTLNIRDNPVKCEGGLAVIDALKFNMALKKLLTPLPVSSPEDVVGEVWGLNSTIEVISAGAGWYYKTYKRPPN